MTTEELEQTKKLVANTPRSIWSYWPFAVPLFLCSLGIFVRISLLWYLTSHFDAEILIRRGNQLERLLDNNLVQRLFLTTNLMLVFGFGAIAFLAAHNLRLKRSLKKLISAETDNA